MFDALDDQIKLTDEEGAAFNSRANAIGAVLKRSGSVRDCAVVGSISRSTAIRDTSDVDVLAVVTGPDATVARAPRQVMAEIARALAESYPEPVIGNIAVSLVFEDNPSVDVIPALQVPEQQGVYMIPSPDGESWQTFAPEALNSLVEQSVNRLGPRFLHLVRLLKRWNHSRKVGLASSDIEELACAATRGDTVIASYPGDILKVLTLAFRWLHGDKRAEELMDRAYNGQYPAQKVAAAIASSLPSVEALAESPFNTGPSRHVLKEFLGGELSNYVD